VSPEPTQVEIHRGVTALVPFVQEWRLALNPEDLEEIAYAVLKHSHGPAVDEDDVGWREIDAAVRHQIAETARGRSS
jgi:hypothetical protein